MICNKELAFNSVIYTLNPISQVRSKLRCYATMSISGPISDTKRCQSHTLRMPPPRSTKIGI